MPARSSLGTLTDDVIMIIPNSNSAQQCNTGDPPAKHSIAALVLSEFIELLIPRIAGPDVSLRIRPVRLINIDM